MVQTSLNSSRTPWHNYAHWSSVEHFIEQVRQLNPLLVVLFGSVATGEFTQYSDADVLVVFEHSIAWEQVYACSDGIVQPVVKTWAELTKQIAAGEPFFFEIFETGQALFDSGGVYDRLHSHVAAVRERWQIERTPSGWHWAAEELV